MSSDWNPPGKERCRYGVDCNRKNPQHFEQYSHPKGKKEHATKEEVEVIVLDSDEDDHPRTKRSRAGEEHAGPSSKVPRKEGARAAPSMEEDEKLARMLQEEELRGLAASGAARNGRREFVADGRGFWLFHTDGIEEPGNEQAVRLRDVVQGDVLWAIFTNYMVQERWLLSEIALLSSIPRVVFMYPFLSSLASPPSSSSIVRYAPPTPQYGVHHSKVMLLGYNTGVRVVVMTANHIHGDHYDMTDALWAQDFPLKGEGEERSEFEDDLVSYFQATQWKGTTLPCGSKLDAQYLRRYSFKNARAKIVASVPGRHQGEKMHMWGHMKMRRILSRETFDPLFNKCPMVWQCTSIGSLSEKWIEEFTSSLCEGKNTEGKNIGRPEEPPHFIWPTMEEVRTSSKGYTMGESIPGFSKNVHKPFLLKMFCRWSSGSSDPQLRRRAMPHIKTWLRFSPSSSPSSPTRVAWILLGSHNLSGAAWGRLEKNASQISITSYEFSVLLLPSLLHNDSDFSCTCGGRQAKEEATLAATTTLPEGNGKKRHLSFFSTISCRESASNIEAPLPLPYSLPPARYAQGKDTPWHVDNEAAGFL
uniref:PBZ-type domain-containing protein n=1 Tax=Guillardia theta TaxID=55529 RepID=A0A7S4KK01_GUITH|mmetsp:Transcript_2618/g.8737  ORF Transcript_2618/g.8737 Transcript_2618/m.8737 type:complete len:588 (+) Transcript_2618:110-1873(+)